jgi:hypothetical protein
LKPASKELRAKDEAAVIEVVSAACDNGVGDAAATEEVVAADSYDSVQEGQVTEVTFLTGSSSFVGNATRSGHGDQNALDSDRSVHDNPGVIRGGHKEGTCHSEEAPNDCMEVACHNDETEFLVASQHNGEYADEEVRGKGLEEDLKAVDVDKSASMADRCVEKEEDSPATNDDAFLAAFSGQRPPSSEVGL